MQILIAHKVFEKKVQSFLFVRCWVDLDMIKYLTSSLLLAHILAHDIGFTIGQGKGNLILITLNTDKFEKIIYNYFKDLKETHGTSNTKNGIEVYPFLGTPVNLASFLFEKTGIIPNGTKKQKLDNSNIGFIYKTCPDNYNIEEDYDGECRRYIFNQKKSKISKNQIDVELEIHKTCLDDSCWYEYHILEFARGVDNKWLILSHRKGNRCYEDRGGGSPPCL